MLDVYRFLCHFIFMKFVFWCKDKNQKTIYGLYDDDISMLKCGVPKTFAFLGYIYVYSIYIYIYVYIYIYIYIYKYKYYVCIYI